MGSTLDASSIVQLADVHPALRAVVQRAIGVSTQSFKVVQGLRTAAQAAVNVAAGVSRTPHSLHLRQADGYAHAVDLAALVAGKVDWDADRYWPITVAMRQAAQDLRTGLRWGGVWDRPLNALQGAPAAEHAAYCARHAGSDLVDLGHFELPLVAAAAATPSSADFGRDATRAAISAPGAKT